MRALSVKQPWAELIARGTKKKELRTWSRSCFGELLIVASKSVDPDDIADEGLDAASLVFGRAVCVVDFYTVTGDDGDHARHLRRRGWKGRAELVSKDDAKATIRVASGSARRG
ncbi:hypothetical protein BH11MYX4_BH11MYX4_05400 [soil metagenome]